MDGTDISKLDVAENNWAVEVWRSAALRPSCAAIVDGPNQWTYGDLRDRAATYAGVLTGAGVRPGDRVGLLLRRTPDAAAALFGALASGAVAVVVADALRSRQVRHIVDHAGIGVVVAGPDAAPQLSGLPEAVRVVAPPDGADGAGDAGDAGDTTAAPDYEPVPRNGNDLAQLIYTSGSTGLPKGVMVTHGNLRAGVQSVGEYLGIRPDDRLASLLPFGFDYGLNQLLVAVSKGATLVIDRSPIAAKIDHKLRASQVTVLAAVPALWRQLLQVERFRSEPIESLRIMTNTGGRLGEDTVARLRAAQPQAALFSMYGLTEAFRSTFLDPSLVDRKPRSVGQAIPGAEVGVVRPDGSACAPFEIGEIVHRGPTVTLGYWRDEATTRRVFHRSDDGDVVVHSGDFGWVDDDGDLYVQGRRDRMVKRLGYRVSPDEIVEAVLASGLAEDACVTAAPVPERSELEVVGHVVLREAADVGELERFLAAELPRHLQPDRLVTYDRLPTTPNGKHDLVALEGAGR